MSVSLFSSLLNIGGSVIIGLVVWWVSSWWSVVGGFNKTHSKGFYRSFVLFKASYKISLIKKILTRLLLGFSHLNEQRFHLNFHDCMNSSCSCSLDIEDTLHYLLHCYRISQHCIDLMKRVKSVPDNFESLCDNVKTDL